MEASCGEGVIDRDQAEELRKAFESLLDAKIIMIERGRLYWEGV